MQALTGLQKWLTVSREEAEFAVEAFKCFLPRRKNYDLGEAWTFVVPDVSLRAGKLNVKLSPDRRGILTHPSTNCLISNFQDLVFLIGMPIPMSMLITWPYSVSCRCSTPCLFCTLGFLHREGWLVSELRTMNS